MTRLALLVLLCSVSSTVLKASDRVPLFVRAAADVDGFTDPSKARRDSLADLLKRISESKILRPVDSEDDAVVIIEVRARETKRETNAWALINGERQNRSSLTVQVTAGEFSTDLTGQSGSKGIYTGYKDAAKSVVKQLEVWVQANRERLTASR